MNIAHDIKRRGLFYVTQNICIARQLSRFLQTQFGSSRLYNTKYLTIGIQF